MRVLSLFDGISAAQQALKNLGITPEYYASEIDKYAIQVTQKNFPNTIQLGDIRNVTKENYPDLFNMEFDLIVGGSPCQDLSIAKNNRKGLDGERSGLFYEYVRILKEVKHKYFLLENVYSMPKESAAEITKIMGVTPIMINSALLTAQNRKRWYWTNIKGTGLYGEIEQPEDRGILLKDILEDGVNSGIANGAAVRKQVGKERGIDIRKDGRANALNSFQNQALVSQKPFQLQGGSQGDRVYSIDGKSVTLYANGGGKGAKTGLYMVSGAAEQVKGRKKNDEGEYERHIEVRPDNKGNAITSVQARNLVTIKEVQIPTNTKLGYDIAKEREDGIRLQFMESKTARGRVIKGKSQTLQTNCEIGVLDNATIRKLTPVECERLQGFPDGFSDNVSNTQRYKALGNSFTVPVIEYILSHIPSIIPRALFKSG